MAVEFAVIAPLLFLVILASVEFCRAMMVVQSLEEAARSGCRVAILNGTTAADIESEVDRILAPAGIEIYDVATQPVDITTAERFAPVSVSVSAAFENMSWVPLPNYLNGKTYQSTCTLPKEYGGD